MRKMKLILLSELLSLPTLGVAADRMATTTYGKERPQAAGSDDLSWAANRRAVSVVR